VTKDAATLRAEIAETRRLADDAKDPEERQRLLLKIIECEELLLRLQQEKPPS
jgi:hypothetical protein